MTAALLSVCTAIALFGRIARPSSRPIADRAVASPTHRGAAPHRRKRLALMVLGGSGALLLTGPLLTLALAGAAAALPRTRALLAQRSTRRSIEAALPDAIEMLTLVLHAGLTPHQAMLMLEERAPEPTRAAFVEVQHRVRRGAPLADALAALPHMLGPTAAPVADVLALTERHGSPISTALEQLGRDVRERRARHAEASARTLPIKMSFPLVLCVLPAFVLVAIVPAVLAALASLDLTTI